MRKGLDHIVGISQLDHYRYHFHLDPLGYTSSFAKWNSHVDTTQNSWFVGLQLVALLSWTVTGLPPNTAQTPAWLESKNGAIQ